MRNAVFENHEIPGYAHFMFIEPGWERIAELCAEWMSGLTPQASASE